MLLLDWVSEGVKSSDWEEKRRVENDGYFFRMITTHLISSNLWEYLDFSSIQTHFFHGPVVK